MTTSSVATDRQLSRFSRGERWVHRVTGALMGACLLTAAVLYLGPLSVLVGRRPVVRTIHVYAGLALPVPLLLGLASAAYRADLRRLNRFHASDWRWLRDRQRRSGRIPVGKFNAGQKLNASFTAGAVLVMFGTGVVMRYGASTPLSWRTGATLVHDWLAYAVAAVVIGHLWFAAKDPIARAGMRTGAVPQSWAVREHGAWADEQAQPVSESLHRAEGETRTSSTQAAKPAAIRGSDTITAAAHTWRGRASGW